jgi:hypothetical protein
MWSTSSELSSNPPKSADPVRSLYRACGVVVVVNTGQRSARHNDENRGNRQHSRLNLRQ